MNHKLLIVIDVQNDFIDGSLANPAAQAKIGNIVERINNFDGDAILVTRDTHTADYRNTKEGEKLPFVHCVKGTDGWYINKDVADALHKKELSESCVVRYFDKPTFGSEELAKAVKEYDGELEIEFVGFCTDICVVSNALMVKAAVYDRADISVIENCCAGVTPEWHEAALTTMNSCQINVVR